VFEPMLRAATDSVTQQVRAVLTPEQRARWDAARPRPRDLLDRQVDTVPR
jgi:hypothetical protein